MGCLAERAGCLDRIALPTLVVLEYGDQTAFDRAGAIAERHIRVRRAIKKKVAAQFDGLFSTSLGERYGALGRVT